MTPKSGCKESHFYSLPFGQAEANIYQPKHHSTSPKNVLMSRLISQYFCNLNSSRNFTWLLGKLITEFTSPIQQYPLALGYRTLLSLHAVHVGSNHLISTKAKPLPQVLIKVTIICLQPFFHDGFLHSDSHLLYSMNW